MENLVGNKYGRLTVLSLAEPHITKGGYKKNRWNCICDCGNKIVVIGDNLRSNNTQSCGCYQKDRISETSIIDLSNQRFGRLVVKEKTYKNGVMYWKCKCDCGNYSDVLPQHLKRGFIKSCGCLRKDVSKNLNRTHGMSKERIYKEWKDIKERCNNEKNTAYSNYGGRNIKVCDEWMKFEPFYEWAMSNGYRDNLTIDRIDNDGNYEPDNCRWVNNTVQANNKRTNIFIEYKNERKTIAEWAREKNISYQTLYNRVQNLKWSIEDALNIPIGQRKCNIEKI